MKNKKIISIYNTLKLIKNEEGLLFNLAIADNINLLEPIIKSFIVQETRINNYISEFNAELNQLIISCAKKDPISEEPIVKKEKNKIIGYELDKDKIDLYNKEYKELEDKHKDSLITYNKERIDFEKFLDEDSNFKPILIDRENLPKNSKTLTTEIIIGFYDLISK